MRLFLSFIISSVFCNGIFSQQAFSQVVLGNSPYTENFDNVASGLPAGFTVKTGATTTILGANASVVATPVVWNNTGGAFKNLASASGLTATSTAAEQANSLNRSLGLRQTGAFGDPGSAFVFQIANSSDKINFKLQFKLQSLDASVTRVANWKVEYGFGSNPLSFIAAPVVSGDLSTGGASFKNSLVSVDFTNVLNNLPDIITIRIVTLDATTGAGNRPTSGIDDFTLSWSEGLSITPIIILNDNGNTSLNFPSTQINSSGVSLSYTLRGENFSEPVTVGSTASFLVSLDNVDFSSSLTVPASEVTINKIIYVRFQPIAAGVSSGSIINSTPGASDKSISVSGEGIDPANLNFDFNSCTSGGFPGSGFTPYSITGVQKWACSNFGQNGTKGVDMNGYSAGAQDNEDWLISPPLLIGGLNLPILRFWSRGEFAGPSLQLLISNDYDGTSDPASATWTDLQADFPLLTNTWALTDGINLSAFKSYPHVYIAFKYSSSPELGAARWTIDDLSISNRTTLLSASPLSLNFGEVTTGAHSTSLAVNIQVLGFGNITLSAPIGYQLSSDNTAFSNSLSVPQALAEAGTTVYARFTPATKELKITGKINFSGTGLDSNTVSLLGTSFPKSETFDVGAYNLSFFGSTPENNPTPAKIETQVNNIATVLKRLNLDIVGFEEMSNDDAMTSLIEKLQGYQSVISPRWSYSFNPPEPNFPPQKTGFIYNTSTVHLIEQRVMFEALYDSARNGLSARLDDYPLASPSSFWASGRLPFMATFDVNIQGIMKRIRIVDIHGKSASDIPSYNRRLYDVKLLKDSLDAYYPNDNIILVGDYNDRVIGSINAGAPSPYRDFVNDSADYKALTLPLDLAGRVSFISGTGLIDHIIISNELEGNYISNSTDIEDARTYISNYNATTASDHLPIFARFNLSTLAPLPVNLSHFEARQSGRQVILAWTTVTEYSNSHFMVERSVDGINFTSIARVNGEGNSSMAVNYQYTDSVPFSGTNYYRLKQVDINGRSTLTQVVKVNIETNVREAFNIYPNPVSGVFRINLNSRATDFVMVITSSEGKLVLRVKGSVSQINEQVNQQLHKLRKGPYILTLHNSFEWHTSKFIKE